MSSMVWRTWPARRAYLSVVGQHEVDCVQLQHQLPAHEAGRQVLQAHKSFDPKKLMHICRQGASTARRPVPKPLSWQRLSGCK